MAMAMAAVQRVAADGQNVDKLVLLLLLAQLDLNA